ncbi:phosphonate ABC transporter substrate-binding protein [Paludifilum halophilum]|uniref:Phosphonate ABC transporter substrate-binding protein n=1 Tax=Paludifilum halophilum TaxID=1642702 RepID=A0A235BA62_9BACL|nr:phosphonate ABC transporter substrate-binding protein [Paludifilum halophilum]
MHRRYRRNSYLTLLLVFGLLLIGAGCSGGQEEDPFQVGVIPAQNKGNMKKAMDKLEKKLSDELNRPVAIKIYSDYQGVVEAMKYKKMDMAFFGPLTFVQAREETGIKAVVTQLIDGKPYYHSYIIVPEDSPLDSIDDLAKNSGKVDFAFGDINSTSGSLIPGIALKKEGVFQDQEHHRFKGVTYTGSHDITALSIQNKKYDAGAIDSAIYEQLVEDGKVDDSKVKVIWKSDRLFQYPWAVRRDIDDQTVKKLRKAFLSIKDPEILSVFGANGFTKAENADYEAIRQAAKEAGRLQLDSN